MEKEFMLLIKFRKALTGPEQNSFWDKIVDCLKSIKAFGGGAQDVFTLNWEIDYGYSPLDEHHIKKHIASFLEKQHELISDFQFYSKR
jgi:hypothetical protein